MTVLLQRECVFICNTAKQLKMITSLEVEWMIILVQMFDDENNEVLEWWWSIDMPNHWVER